LGEKKNFSKDFPNFHLEDKVIILHMWGIDRLVYKEGKGKVVTATVCEELYLNYYKYF